MKRIMSVQTSTMVLSLTFVLIAGATIGRSEAQQGTFVLTVCNQSGEAIILSIANRVAVNDSRFVLKGWFPVGNGCVQAPAIPKGYLYYFAMVPKQGGKYWGGNTNMCVGIKGNFQRLIAQNYTCRQGEESLAPFAELQVAQDTITLPFK